MTPRARIGYVVGFVGLLWAFATLVVAGWLFYVGKPLPMYLFTASLSAGGVAAWWGFYWADGKRAKGGGEFLLSAEERIRAGRRKDDPVVFTPVPSAPPSLPDEDSP
jgi:hypothetical protein